MPISNVPLSARTEYDATGRPYRVSVCPHLGVREYPDHPSKPFPGALSCRPMDICTPIAMLCQLRSQSGYKATHDDS